jgi:hypothetical protein
MGAKPMTVLARGVLCGADHSAAIVRMLAVHTAAEAIPAIATAATVFEWLRLPPTFDL